MDHIQLVQNIVEVLKGELGRNVVSSINGQILIRIATTDFEFKLGDVLQNVFSIVERHFPTRAENLSIVIRDSAAKYESVFKLWKS